MMALFVNLFLVYSVFGVPNLIEGLALPDYIKLCSRSDPKINDCLVTNGNQALEHIVQADVKLILGDKQRKIPSFSPLKIDAITIEPSDNLKLDMKHTEVRGIENIKLEKAEIDIETMKIYSELILPHAEIVGDYEMNGKILILPIKGQGKANITLDTTSYHYTVYLEKVEKKGIEQYAIKKSEVKYIPKRVYYDFTNLFNGDQNLGPQMLLFMNENWKEIDQEFSGALNEILKQLSEKVLTNLIKGVPTTQVLLD